MPPVPPPLELCRHNGLSLTKILATLPAYNTLHLLKISKIKLIYVRKYSFLHLNQQMFFATLKSLKYNKKYISLMAIPFDDLILFLNLWSKNGLTFVRTLIPLYFVVFYAYLFKSLQKSRVLIAKSPTTCKAANASYPLIYPLFPKLNVSQISRDLGTFPTKADIDSGDRVTAVRIKRLFNQSKTITKYLTYIYIYIYIYIHFIFLFKGMGNCFDCCRGAKAQPETPDPVRFESILKQWLKFESIC